MTDSGSDTTDFMLNWLKDIPDNPVDSDLEPVLEPKVPISRYKENVSKDKSTYEKMSYVSSSYYQVGSQPETLERGDNSSYENDDLDMEYSRLSLTSDGEDIIIPFDSKPIVSKFGPISRVIKPKPKSTNPVQAIADENMVTSVTSSLKSQPQVFPSTRVPSRKVNQPISALLDGENSASCTGYSRLVNYPPNVKSCVKKEIARLEEKALNADTEDEWLACELQAVELQISLTSKPAALIKSTTAADNPSEDLTGTKLWAQYSNFDRTGTGYSRDWTNLDKALQAQEIETECLKSRKKQEKEDRLLAQKLVLEELNAASPHT